MCRFATGMFVPIKHFPFSSTQHEARVLHQGNLQRESRSNARQILLPTMQIAKMQTPQQEFNKDLCKAFVAADIPLDKLANPSLKRFVEKYSKQVVPHPSTLRKNYIKQLYDETMQSIREDIGSNEFWVGADETTDSAGRYIVNVIIRALRSDRTSKSHLFASREISSANHETIANTVDDSLRNLLPDSSYKQRMLLLLTDSAPYMKKAGRALKIFYPKMIHVTCLAHALHLVAEEVRNHSQTVDKLISNVKKIFTKSPKRITMYRQMCPDLAMPPKPIITRWGTWLKAVDFYRQNYADVKKVVASLNPKESKCIAKAQELFENGSLCTNLAYLSANFTFLADLIMKIEDEALSLDESTTIVDDALNKLKQVQGSLGPKVLQKFNSTIEKNTGYEELRSVLRAIKFNETDQELGTINLNPTQLCKFTYAQIVTCDVERSFSRLKGLFRDNRHSFLSVNLEMFIIVNCNANYNYVTAENKDA